jgi:uncharacterized coiled-coil protein SlyX
MDRNVVTPDNSFQVSLEEIVAELNKQIANLNFELTASKIAIQKMQKALQNSFGHSHDYDDNHTHDSSKIIAESF